MASDRNISLTSSFWVSKFVFPKSFPSQNSVNTFSLILNTDSVLYHCLLYFTINSDNIFDSRWRQTTFAFSKFSIPALEPKQLSSHWLSGTFYSGVMRPVGEDGVSHPSRADVKTE